MGRLPPHERGFCRKDSKNLAKGEKVHVGGKNRDTSDLSALFTVRATHLLQPSQAEIAFVLPMAALSRGQLSKSFALAAWLQVEPLGRSVDNGRARRNFPVLSCVVFGRRALGRKMPDKIRTYSGWFPAGDTAKEPTWSVIEGADAPQRI